MRVGPHHFRSLIDAVVANGIQAKDFLQRGGIAEERLQNGWFELADLDRLTVLATELTGDPAFGVKWGEYSALMQYDLIGFVVAQAPSFKGAIELAVRYQMMFAERPEISFVDKNGSAQLRCDPLAISDTARRVRGDWMVVVLMRFLRQFGGAAGAVLKRAMFEHGAPAYAQEYDRVFGSGMVRFGQPFYGLEFQYAALDNVQPTRNSDLANKVQEQVERGLVRTVEDHSTTQRVLTYVRGRLPNTPEITDAARILGIPERSLRRKLAAEGSSFSQVVEQTQLELARELLDDSTIPLKKVAHLLGFASTSGFHRAFLRWTETSPTRYRARR